MINLLGGVLMKSEEYWVTFSKSGKIEDYLVFLSEKNKEKIKGSADATKHKRTYP